MVRTIKSFLNKTGLIGILISLFFLTGNAYALTINLPGSPVELSNIAAAALCCSFNIFVRIFFISLPLIIIGGLVSFLQNKNNENRDMVENPVIYWFKILTGYVMILIFARIIIDTWSVFGFPASEILKYLFSPDVNWVSNSSLENIFNEIISGNGDALSVLYPKCCDYLQAGYSVVGFLIDILGFLLALIYLGITIIEVFGFIVVVGLAYRDAKMEYERLQNVEEAFFTFLAHGIFGMLVFYTFLFSLNLVYINTFDIALVVLKFIKNYALFNIGITA